MTEQNNKFDLARTTLSDFFNRCIGTGDERLLVDVVITDSFIKQYQASPNGEGQRVVDSIESKDINFVFDNEHYRTFRTPTATWDKTISVLKKLAYFEPGVNELGPKDIDPRLEELNVGVNRQFYRQQFVLADLGVDYHVSMLFSDPAWLKRLEGITDGDLAAIETRFSKAGEMLGQVFNKIKSNLVLLGNDQTIKRDHILHFANFIDFEKHHVHVSLNKFGVILSGDEDKDFGLTPKPLNVDEWKDTFTSEASKIVLLRLVNAFNQFNEYVDQFLSIKETDHFLRKHAIEYLFKNAWGAVMKTSDMVYTIDPKDVQEQTLTAAEDILNTVASLSEQPGLDLNSLKVYDYTNPSEPVLVQDLSPELHKQYRQEFVTIVAAHLLSTKHPLCRPYGVKTLITDPEEIAARPVGDVRTERF